MWIYFYPTVFILGLVWGSFINMAVYRVKNELDFFGRSFCDDKKEKLGALDLIPVLSFFISKGRCRHCHKPLPWIYPVTELVTAVSFCLAFWTIMQRGTQFPWYVINLAITGIVVVFFIFFAVYDYLYWEVNVLAVKTALILAVVFAVASIFFPQIVFPGLSGIFAGLIAGLIIAFVVKFTKGSGMGEGDIFLMAFAGILVGLSGFIPLFMISSITGSIIGIIKAIKVGKLHGVQIQFVPFISFAALLIIFFKEEILGILRLDVLINNL